MKLVSNIINDIKVSFEDLEIGAAYFDVTDGDEVFCIKVSDTECLFHTVDGMWATLVENPSLLVVPLNVTIIINGYKKLC